MTAAEGLAALKPTHHAAWEPRRVLTLGAARRRSAIVRNARLGMIIASGLLVLLIIVQILTGGAPADSGATGPVSNDVRMTNPRFTGRDDNQTPFTVTADVAVRSLVEGEEITELEHPRLDYNLFAESADASEVLADRGRFNAQQRILDLYADVNLTTRSGYTFLTEHARIFLREERVAGSEPVNGSGPLGEIRADSYEIRESGALVVFQGGVVARLYNGTESAAGADQSGE